jgi:hypothetical protein
LYLDNLYSSHQPHPRKQTKRDSKWRLPLALEMRKMVSPMTMAGMRLVPTTRILSLPIRKHSTLCSTFPSLGVSKQTRIGSLTHATTKLPHEIYGMPIASTTTAIQDIIRATSLKIFLHMKDQGYVLDPTSPHPIQHSEEVSTSRMTVYVKKETKTGKILKAGSTHNLIQYSGSSMILRMAMTQKKSNGFPL